MIEVRFFYIFVIKRGAILKAEKFVSFAVTNFNNFKSINRSTLYFSNE